MPTFLRLDDALFKWQARHGKRMTYAELARRTGISIPTLYRMKSGELSHPDLRKINEICKALECEPGDVLQRVDTQELDSQAVQEASSWQSEEDSDE